MGFRRVLLRLSWHLLKLLQEQQKHERGQVEAWTGGKVHLSPGDSIRNRGSNWEPWGEEEVGVGLEKGPCWEEGSGWDREDRGQPPGGKG